MQLNILSARTGATWVRQGVRTFFRQPMALTGLFFMFMAAVSVTSLIPVLGSVLALGLLPAATLGLMAATREAEHGRFPMPAILVTAFRAGRQQVRSMAVLGALYALGFLVIMGLSALVDGGGFARLYLLGGQITQETVTAGHFQAAMWVSMLLYLPLSLMFWHAPALVHWHGIPPVKSLFFSFVACARNLRAYLVYGLLWLGVFLGAGLVVATVATLVGSPQAAGVAMLPVALLMAAMFFSSIWFTFRDSFGDDLNESDRLTTPA